MLTLIRFVRARNNVGTFYRTLAHLESGLIPTWVFDGKAPEMNGAKVIPPPPPSPSSHARVRATGGAKKEGDLMTKALRNGAFQDARLTARLTPNSRRALWFAT
jgi:hypothetical protein